jgi:hypothetical protein
MGQRLPGFHAAARRRTKQRSRAERPSSSAVKLHPLDDNFPLDVTSYPRAFDGSWEYIVSAFADEGSHQPVVEDVAAGQAHMQSLVSDSNATGPAHNLHPLLAGEGIGVQIATPEIDGPMNTPEIDEPITPSSVHSLGELGDPALRAETTASPTCTPRDVENRRDGHITLNLPGQASDDIFWTER